MNEIMQGYHFVGETLRNDAPIPPDGEWLIFNGLIRPCQSGLHMSEHPYDALLYAPGSVLCRVELAGELQSHGDPTDKWVGRRRRIVARADATQMMRLFAQRCALDVAHLWDIPEVVREYLETGKETLRSAAQDAAQDAARTAAWAWAHGDPQAAAWAAAQDNPRDAAQDAERASTRAWAQGHAGTAERAATRAAARDSQRARFLAMTTELLRQPMGHYEEHARWQSLPNTAPSTPSARLA